MISRYIGLHTAASNGGRSKHVEMLIAQCARVDASDIFGNTPLHLTDHETDKETYDLLIKNGANLSAEDNYGNTPKSKRKLEAYQYSGYTSNCN